MDDGAAEIARAASRNLLPSLGSRVRIPSPAPGFLKNLSRLERSSGAAFFFPSLQAMVGEALGKPPEAGRGGRAARCGTAWTPTPSPFGSALSNKRASQTLLNRPLNEPERVGVLDQRPHLGTLQATWHIRLDLESKLDLAARQCRQLLHNDLDDLMDIPRGPIRRDHDCPGEPGRLSLDGRWRRGVAGGRLAKSWRLFVGSCRSSAS